MPTLPSFKEMQSHMNSYHGHSEPSLLQLKAAVFGHSPADMCYHNIVRATEQKPHDLIPFLDPFFFSDLLPTTLRWADDRANPKGWVQPVGANLLRTLKKGLPTAPFRATILQRSPLPLNTEEPGGPTFLALAYNSRVLRPFCPVCSTQQIKAQMFPLLTLSVAPLE